MNKMNKMNKMNRINKLKSKDKMSSRRKNAYIFLILFGFISMFSDFTFEGSRSIIGPYLRLLGASAVTIGFVSGLGELIGYTIRLVTGLISDRTRRYWTMTIIGYSMNLFAIPLLAFVPANGWVLACILVVLERLGKAIRHPAKNTLVSFAASEVGAGRGFALQEVMDQFGAFAGPLLIFLILTMKNGHAGLAAYQASFLALGATAVITLIILLTTKKIYPAPENFDISEPVHGKLTFDKAFWLYMGATGLMAAGFADFPLLAFHLVDKQLIQDSTIPALYSLAMAFDALAALLFGWIYDKRGIISLMLATGISAMFAPLAFLGQGMAPILAGVIFWGIGMGAQESILKATITTLVPKNRRATAFGIFHTGFGACWFLGSWLMGAVYESSIPALVGFSVLLQLLAIPVLILVRRSMISA